VDRCGRRYLSTSNYDFSYDRAKNLRPKRNIKTAMNNEIMLQVTKNQTNPASCSCHMPKPHPCPLFNHRYGIAQKEQMGFDKALEVRSKPLQLLATFARLLPCTALTPCRLCFRRSASTVRLWPRPTATTHRPLDARPCADRACIVCAGMSRYGVTPNMLVLPPQMLLYMALAPEQKLSAPRYDSNAHARAHAHAHA
jgi:hypothetical protein